MRDLSIASPSPTGSPYPEPVQSDPAAPGPGGVGGPSAVASSSAAQHRPDAAQPINSHLAPAAPPLPERLAGTARGSASREAQSAEKGLAARGTSAAELRLLATRPQVSSGPEEVYPQLEKLLSRSLNDPAIRDSEVRQVHRKLESLNPADYAEVLNRMEKGGLLSRYVAEQSSGAREEFVNQLVSREVLVRAPGRQPPGGFLSPPAVPALLDAPPSLLPTVRAVAMSENFAAARAYRSAHGEYVERFNAAVGQASNPAELRLLGPPHHRAALTVLGLEPGRDAHLTIAFHRALGVDTSYRGYVAIRQRQSALASEMAPGSMKVTAGAAATMGPLDAKLEFGLEDWRVVIKPSITLNPSFGPLPLALRETVQMVDGQLRGERRLELAIPQSAAAREKADLMDQARRAAEKRGVPRSKLPKRGQRGMPSASLGADGTMGFKVPVGPFLSAETSVTPAVGRATVGVSSKVELKEHLSAGVGLTAHFQGANPKHAEAIAKGKTLPDAPPDLALGVPWSALPRERREALVADGIRPEFWEEIARNSSGLLPEDWRR